MAALSLNVTSTKNPGWREDCERFRIAAKPFELRDVHGPEHEAFVKAFEKQHRWNITGRRKVAVFSPPAT